MQMLHNMKYDDHVFSKGDQFDRFFDVLNIFDENRVKQDAARVVSNTRTLGIARCFPH